MKPTEASGKGPRRWYLVGFMAALYALSMIDRFLLAVIAQPVTENLGLSNVQMGLLMGAGFAILYSIAGVPIAQLADHGNRKGLVLIGVSVWSLSTIGCAFAEGFEHLLVLRAGVAVGEAVLTPAALSMFADLFDEGERALPTSTYMAVGNFMASGAFIVGAAAYDLAASLETFWEFEAWRGSFLLLGMPGIVFVLLGTISLREPARIAAGDAPVKTSVSTVLAYLKQRSSAYVPFFMGTGAISAATLGLISWMPTVLQRTFSFEAADASYIFGIVGVPATMAGAFAMPWLATRLNRLGRRDGVVLVLMLCVIVPPALIVPAILLGSTALIIAALVSAMFLLPSVTVVTCFALQSYAPARMRARLVALNLLVINLFGYTVGPLTVAHIADRWFTGELGAGYGLAILMAAAAPVAIASYAITRSRFDLIVQGDTHSMP